MTYKTWRWAMNIFNWGLRLFRKEIGTINRRLKLPLCPWTLVYVRKQYILLTITKQPNLLLVCSFNRLRFSFSLSLWFNYFKQVPRWSFKRSAGWTKPLLLPLVGNVYPYLGLVQLKILGACSISSNIIARHAGADWIAKLAKEHIPISLLS